VPARFGGGLAKSSNLDKNTVVGAIDERGECARCKQCSNGDAHGKWAGVTGFFRIYRIMRQAGQDFEICESCLTPSIGTKIPAETMTTGQPATTQEFSE
jgi:hypothetical protein